MFLILSFFITGAANSFAQTPLATDAESRLRALERIVAPVRPAYRYRGFGPSASKIYDEPELGARVGFAADVFTLGVGTLPSAGDASRSHASVYALAPTLGYHPHARVVLNSQIVFENGGAERSDTVTLRKGGAVVRYAYLDWLGDSTGTKGARLGHQLIPIGMTNTGVDAITYFGVRRPLVERTILPADWHENGLLGYYNPEAVSIEAGAFASLNQRHLRGESFLADGRSQGQSSPADDVMGVVRINYHDDTWQIVGSAVMGATAQSDLSRPPGRFTLGELHANFRRPRFEATAQMARGQLTDANLISQLNQTALPSEATGHSIEAAAELLGESSPRRLWGFVRFARVTSGGGGTSGVSINPTLNQTHAQIGAQYLPLPALVIKADLTQINVADGSSRTEGWIGAGLLF